MTFSLQRQSRRVDGIATPRQSSTLSTAGLALRGRAAARLCELNRRTHDGPVRTEHAAIPRLGAQQRTTACALVEKYARVSGHRFHRLVSAMRTSQSGFQNYDWHKRLSLRFMTSRSRVQKAGRF